MNDKYKSPITWGHIFAASFIAGAVSASLIAVIKWMSS